jgi:hypothetical protein
VMIWGYTAASAVTFWGVKSTDNGVTWGTPFVVAQEPTIDHTAEYLHMADLNHAQWVFFVYQDQTATNRAIKAGRFPTAGGAGTIVPLNATSGTDVSFYTGNCKPIACDPTAGTPPVYIVFRGNPTSAGTGVYYSGNLGVSFTGSIAIPGAQRYPNTAMQAAAATPWVFSNVGVPASGAYHWAWYSYDELGYNGGSWTAVDTLAVAPGPYDGVRPLLYQNQGHWWDAQRGVASENLWGQFTPEGLYTNYTTNGGSTWIGFSRRWHFQDDQIDAGTTSNCEIVGGTNGVAYVITCGMTGVTDVTAPIIGEQRLLGATNPPGLGPYVVSCAIVENSGIGLSGATIYWTHPQVDSGDYNDAGADSAQLSDPNTGSGTYFFTIPATHSNGDPVVQGDSIFFYCEFTDDYLNTSSHPEQIIIAGVAYLGVSDRVAGPVSGFALNANYPNPFNPTTTLSFDLPANYRATLKVYNALGQQVATLMNGETLSAGHHIVTFDGSILSSGVYICRLTAGPYTAARKMVLMK